MKYSRILSYVASTLWAIDSVKWAEILAVLSFRASGHEFTAEEIEARISSRQSGPAPSANGIGYVPIRGVVANRIGGMDESSGGTSAERIGAQVRQFAGDPNIGTILFDVDSPGGTVPGVQETAAAIFEARSSKRIVAHVNDLAASAAYWMASQAHEIISTPSGSVGSIGVFAAHQDVSKALAAEGIDVTLISAGKYKVEGSPFAPLSKEAKQFMQDRVDDAYGQFVKDVARGRGVSVGDVRNGYGEGRALVAKDAMKAGMIDGIGTLEETLAKLSGRKATAGLRAEEYPDRMTAIAEFSAAERRRRLERF